MERKFIKIPLNKTSMAKRKNICSVGVNDADYVVKPKIDGKQVECIYYKRWKSIVKRTCSDEYKIKHPGYKDVTICDEWLSFMNFRSWMIQQDWQGKEIDKDILSKEQKIYSPETCCFVTQEINTVLSHFSRKGKYPTGVKLPKTHKKYTSTIKINGKEKHLGCHATIREAHIAYIKAKIPYIKTFFSQVDDRVKNGFLWHIKEMEKSIAI